MCDRINGRKNVSSAGCSELGAEMIEKRGYDVVAEASVSPFVQVMSGVVGMVSLPKPIMAFRNDQDVL